MACFWADSSVNDNESSLYYLQSRYYDPALGRFINADAFASTGQGLLGNNMFAYCGNNPVMYEDSAGNRYCAATTVEGESDYDRFISCDYQNELLRQKQAADATPVQLARTAEQKVIDASYFSFYNGAPYVKIEALDGNAFSFGVIFVGPNVDEQTIKHEYGHFVHLCLIGPLKYTSKVVVPSLIDFWSGTPYSSYYSEPQEYIADTLGQVNRRYDNKPYPYHISPFEAITYFVCTFLP